MLKPLADRTVSAELYVPSEQLVRATVGTASALGYVPSTRLVARTLAGSRRRGARFRMPAHLMPDRVMARSGRAVRARAAAIGLAAFGLSPAALAAATVVHLALFAAAGWMLGSAARSIHDSLTRGAAQAPAGERLIYFVAGAPNARRAPATKQLPAASADSMAARGDRATVAARRAAVKRELERALAQELVFEGDRGEVRLPDRPILDRLAGLLRQFPEARIKLVGEAPFSRGGREPTSIGARDAEAAARYLFDRGVERERVSVELTGAPHPECREDPGCRARKRLLRIRMDSTAARVSGGVKPGEVDSAP
jgi:outer membrane protein OmpA-like peptidoglycan-associated protein